MTAGVASASPVAETSAASSPSLQAFCPLNILSSDSMFCLSDLALLSHPSPSFLCHRRKQLYNNIGTFSPEALVSALRSVAHVELREKSAKEGSVHRDLVNFLLTSDVDTAVYIADIGSVIARYFEFVTALPRVTPHYAVKCNPDPVVVRTLALLGANFDCASSEEIKLVAGLGVADLDSRIVYANPCKPVDHIRYAASLGITCMTFDCEDELYKIHGIRCSSRLLLRIAVDDAASLCPLSSKYGASLHDISSILRTASCLGLVVVGVAFHVGSGCTSVAAYISALHRARAVFDCASNLGMQAMSVLDIGGGFPGFDGESPITFSQIAATLRETLDELFDPSVHVIAEPGRYFVSRAFTLATQVVARRKTIPEQNALVIGDGVYGSFKDAILLNLWFKPQGYIKPSCTSSKPYGEEISLQRKPTTLYGPTCDARDVVARDVPLPALQAGDWLYFSNMGAYTMSLATNYNGFVRPKVYYHISL